MNLFFVGVVGTLGAMERWHISLPSKKWFPFLSSKASCVRACKLWVVLLGIGLLAWRCTAGENHEIFFAYVSADSIVEGGSRLSLSGLARQFRQNASLVVHIFFI